MADVWKTPFKELPQNGQTVWIRVLNIYGEPVVATFDANTQLFTTVLTGVVIPLYQASRWKPYPFQS